MIGFCHAFPFWKLLLPQDDSQGMMTNYVVCNYATQGNFMGKSIYTEVTISITLHLANPTQPEISSTQTC